MSELLAEVKGKGAIWFQLDLDSLISAQVVRTLRKTFAKDAIRAEMEPMDFGPLRLIQAVLPHMRGVLVNMSGGAALEARGSMGAYAGAKAGLETLTIALGTFNTGMGKTAMLGRNPLSGNDMGSVAKQTIRYISSGDIVPNGDKD
ncbi:MAG: hypothetical protein ASARMPREDX12_003441 [Alectoria sarmentosa]|nr:MAG: hypothetical protein ASARMPREDX12_003441 [Alectoria sarmentosa]